MDGTEAIEGGGGERLDVARIASASRSRTGRSMSAITTFIPSTAKRRASANPMPDAAPVTTATRPVNRFMKVRG
jgi:hypothetical protein